MIFFANSSICVNIQTPIRNKMKLHEYQARYLFDEYQIPIAVGDIADTPEGAVAIAKKTGFPVVIKAQVLVGGRGKAGGVKIVSTKEVDASAKQTIDISNQTNGCYFVTIKNDSGSITKKIILNK